MDNPLVSVCVITYNSSKYVLETLESIKAQTYKNIELIVSDDCSKDNTVEICQKWIDENKSRFVNAQMVTSDINTGIAPNCNRANKRAKGEWLKNIAGDDMLLPNCITDDIEYVTAHPDTDILFTKIKCFGDVKDGYNPFGNVDRYFTRLTQEEFILELLMGDFLPASSAFIHLQCFYELRGWDESIPFVEDWPFWCKAISMGYKLACLSKATVCYRISETSISQNNSKKQDNRSKYAESDRRIRERNNKYLSNKYFGFKYFYWSHNTIFEHSLLGKILHYTNIINPFWYRYLKISRKVNR